MVSERRVEMVRAGTSKSSHPSRRGGFSNRGATCDKLSLHRFTPQSHRDAVSNGKSILVVNLSRHGK